MTSCYRRDYAGVCKVLSIIKLLRFCENEDDILFHFVVDFAAPFLFEYEKEYSAQWSKLRKAFSIIRHMSYLTVDLPFSGHKWTPNIPDLSKYYLENNDHDIDYVSENISELMSPVVRNIYDTLYHSDLARKEMSIYAERVETILNSTDRAGEEIQKWLNLGLQRYLKLGRLPKREKIERCVMIRLRSHFLIHPDSCVELEEKLKKKGFSHPSVFEYKSWNSDILFEPDELIIDVLLDKAPIPSDFGKLLFWFTSEFDSTNIEPDDFFYMTRKSDIEAGYYQILSRSIETHFPGITVKLDPWRLKGFGLFDKYGLSEARGNIWIASAEMDDPISKHLFRDRRSKISKELAGQYEELMGLKALKDSLKKKWKGKKPRCRWLLITSSVKFLKNEKIIMEYDGGLLKVLPISGRLTWYGLETKKGKENPERSLRKRLSKLGIQGKVDTINQFSAYVEIPF